jgi:hypothetical protein
VSAQSVVNEGGFNLSLQAKRRIQTPAPGATPTRKIAAMSKPPPLPANVLARVLRIAGIDGFTLVFIAGGFALLSVTMGDWLGALVGGLAAGAGLIELHGRRRLRVGDICGVNWLVRSQIVLLTIILIYAAHQFYSYDPQPMLAKLETLLVLAQRTLGLEIPSLAEFLGMTNKQLLALAKNSAHGAYLVIGVASLLCQGGLAFYYHCKGPTITRALRKT